MLKLLDIAYSRSGDKGSHANIGVIAFNQAGFEYLKNTLTAESLMDYFAPLKPKKVHRYELPKLLALNFVLEGILEGGGSRSLRLDNQGKALGQALLQLPLDLSPKELELMKRA